MPRARARSRLLPSVLALLLGLGWLIGLPVRAAADGPTPFTNAASIAIPSSASTNQSGPASPYPSNITVSGMTGAVTKVTVSFNNLTHGIANDIDALVVAPGGANLLVMSDAASTGTFTFANNATLTFDDAAANQLPQAGAIATGSYQPTNRNLGAADAFPAPAPTPSTDTTLAEAFTGLASANGTWSLYVVDDTTGDLGTMAGGWTVTITTEVAAVSTTTIVTSSDATSTTGQPVTFTATVRAGATVVTAGTVQFTSDGVSLGAAVPLNASGIASLTTSATALAEGTHLIRATYSGATGFLTSNGTLTQRVDNATTVNGNTFCNTGQITLPDSGTATPYPSNIFVTGLSGQITKVTANLIGVNHQASIDLDVLLAGPTPAQNLILLSDAGGNLNPITTANLVFDDAATGPVPSPIVSGTFRPTDLDPDSPADPFPAPAPALSGATALSTFNDGEPNGTWSLWVVDDATGDTGSISGGWCLTVTAQAATETALTSSLNPSTFGDEVTFTATVTADGDPVTEGSIQFSDGGTNLGGPVAVNAAGVATYTTTTPLTVGSHSIAATYGGTDDFGESDATLTQVVNLGVTETTLTSDNNPSDVGEQVIFTATVTDADGDPLTSGSVQFSDDGAPLDTVAVAADGTATFTTTTLTAGTHPITATFVETAQYAESSDDLDQVVARIVTETVLTSNNNPSDVGEDVTFTATVTDADGDPVTSGSVQFADDGTALDTVAVAADGTATFTTGTLTAGTHPITATFVETAQYAESSDDLDQVVARILTETVLTSDNNPSDVGESVTFTATVTDADGDPPTSGSVQFSDGGTALGPPVPLAADGTAPFTTTTLTAGTHPITATFVETAQYAESSDDLDQVVARILTETVLTSNNNPSEVGESVTFTATVTDADGDPVTSGTVQFTDDGAPLGIPQLVNGAGVATLVVADLTAGPHPIEATFIETAQYAESTSNTVNQVVGRVPTTTTLSSVPNPSDVGELVTFTATVTVTAGGAPLTPGTVEFRDNGTLIGTGTLGPGGQATFTTSTLPAGTHPITATFIETAQYATSSDDLDQVVERIVTETVLQSLPNPSDPGDSVTFTATVTDPNGDPVTVGSVTFTVDNVPIAGGPVAVNASGIATFDTAALDSGAHTVVATYAENATYETSDATAIQVVRPVADADGPYAVAEGASLTLGASGSTDGAIYAWDVDGDGDFTDATGEAPTLTWDELEALGINDGPSTFSVTLRVTLDGGVAESETELTVTNTAPAAVLTGGMTATVGVPFTIKVGADDYSSADMAGQFTYTVNWGDGSPVQTVPGPADPPVTHIYTAAGDFAAVFTATDKDGDTGDPTSVTVEVSALSNGDGSNGDGSDDDGSNGDGSGGDGSDDGSSNSDLASTGSTVGLGTILIGLALLVGGSGLLLVSRRRRGHGTPRHRA